MILEYLYFLLHVHHSRLVIFLPIQRTPNPSRVLPVQIMGGHSLRKSKSAKVCTVYTCGKAGGMCPNKAVERIRDQQGDERGKLGQFRALLNHSETADVTSL